MPPKHRVDIFGIGVQRSGTTWLFEALDAHPEVSTANRANNKELNFFNHHYYKGLHWYHNLFADLSGPAVDFTVLYFPTPAVPDRLHEYNPNAKLILSLRDPIERAYSQHKLQCRRGWLPESDRSFREGLLSNQTYVQQGLYATHLKQYLRNFSLDQIHLIRFDDLSAQPERVLRNLYGFLDIGRDFQPDHLAEKKNESRFFRSNTLKDLRFAIANYLRSGMGEWSVEAIKLTGLPRMVKSLNSQSPRDKLPPPDPDTVQQLQDTYGPEIEELEELTGHDFSDWLERDYSWR